MRAVVVAQALPRRRWLSPFRHLATLLGAVIVGAALLVCWVRIRSGGITCRA